MYVYLLSSSLQRELNKELHSVFSESLLFAHDDEGEENDNFASLNLDELSDDIETVLQRNKPGSGAGSNQMLSNFQLKWHHWLCLIDFVMSYPVWDGYSLHILTQFV